MDENQMGEFKMALKGNGREREREEGEGEEFGCDRNGKLLSAWKGICRIETVRRDSRLLVRRSEFDMFLKPKRIGS